MSRLSQLIENAFKRSRFQSSYSYAPWRIVFVDRVWDSYFEIYYFKQRIASGNTGDKNLTILSEDQTLAQKVIEDFIFVFPEYQVISNVKG